MHLKYYIFQAIFCLSFLDLTAQSKEVEPVEYDVDVPADAAGWTVSTVHVKKGDFVLFEVSGTVDLGMITKDIPPTGSMNILLESYNRYPEYKHGILICSNGDEMVPAVSKDHPNPNKMSENGLSLDLIIDPGDAFNVFADMQPVLKEQLPAALQDDFDEDEFVGNYFTSKKDQSLRFIINDKKVEDNENSFSVKVTVLPKTGTPYLNAGFHFADYVDDNKGNLPFCMARDCIADYPENRTDEGGLWFKGCNTNGHYYLAINVIGPYKGTVQEAIAKLKDNIYYAFPFNAVDVTLSNTPEKSKVILNHLYYLSVNMWTHLPNQAYPEVLATEVSNYHFTFKTNGWKHVLRGSAIHGLFKDKCGILYLFQEGRGLIGEEGWRKELQFFMTPAMWVHMAANMVEVLHL